MGCTQVALEEKPMDMYPEIEKNGLSIALELDRGKNAWKIPGNRFFEPAGL
ncbi:hypothetical protein BMS3Abin07_02183 [bacterium BMS3Abin07]|nr:hypothetical protein BMS3Abin07_02183 [bacterium BMS3Abin07]